MPRTVRQRVKRGACYRLARMIHPVLLAYLDLYDQDDDEPGSGEDKQRIDLTGTVSGQFEVAANRDHGTPETVARFGFTSSRRTSGTTGHTARPGATRAPG